MSTCKNTVIIIVGATASGKTALSLDLAKHLHTSVISADSRQCFRELDIGVAKPSPEELQSVKHYFINSHSIFDSVTAQTFEAYALDAVNEIFQSNRFAVMAGGTGLYVKAFCEGLDKIPAVSDKIKQFVTDNYNKNGLLWLQQELSERDPLFWAMAEQQNPQRLMRAVEVLYETGKSITAFRTGNSKQRPFNIIKIGLNVSKEQLYQHIDTRIDRMMQQGLLTEVKSLMPYRDRNALQSLGYKELLEYLDGKLLLHEAIENIRINTRRYAKRQLTWFRKDRDIHWVEKNSFSKNSELLAAFNFFTMSKYRN